LHFKLFYCNYVLFWKLPTKTTGESGDHTVVPCPKTLKATLTALFIIRTYYECFLFFPT